MVHRLVGQLAQADGGQRVIHPAAHRRFVQPEIERAEGNILDHAGREQLAIRVLENQPDPAAQRIQAPAAVIDRLAGKAHAAGGRPQQGVEVLQQGGFARAVAAEQRIAAAAADGQRAAVEADAPVGINVAEGAGFE